MDELVNQVQSKTGISHDQAQQAAQTVIDYLKARLPGPVAGQIDNALKGNANMGDMAKNVGGMFGQK